MSVRDFMSKDLITVNADTPIFDAIDLMKKNKIHRLPVVEGRKLIGLITEGVIQEALPSKATSLSVYEVNYLLNKTNVKDIMIKKVETTKPDALLEDAIAQMREKNVGVLPVLENDAIIGIITNNDIFDAFLKITGYYAGGTRISIFIEEDHPGILADLTKLFASHELSILTIVVNHLKQGTIVEIQVESKDPSRVKELVTQAGYEVLSAVLTNQ
ncbi:CBS and ACT domain-containing protein [Enterococcus lemanii]|uniref:CBS and ACT domain-containing protein n=1 Tax=Enterococcus lemanii TaxID=1159752 RepID=A0ABV9MVZ1_9ENTE|nr:CBS and ACT domain-containing protein [Enterococcus lemanii]MBM7710337.1 acetoin utilization protein AcuB [Enterococcus lemanii]NLM65799.1 CBS domain-containing protein [Enterococcus sp.]